MLKKLNQLHFRMQLRKEKINFYINVLTVSAYGVIIGMLVYYVLNDVISVGAFAAVFAALREFYGFMDEVISERLAIAIENMATVKNYLAFIQEEKEEPRQIELHEKFEIRLEHVFFAYPQPETGKEKFVLSDINLRIPWGQTVALVGENGSGKSTLCNIIGGLYAPAKGTVSHGEVQGGTGRIVNGISSVFQKFCRYSMTLGENIRISDMSSHHSEEKLHQVCEDAGVVPGWAGGMGGMLGREFGGAEVSGGQWQRIAIARGMYRSNSLLILDEPTAALDAIAENELYQRYNELTRNRTSLFISHRLASTQFCDRILMLEEGRIVEQGSHEELMGKKGAYYRMFQVQSHYYQKDRKEGFSSQMDPAWEVSGYVSN